jgi:EpsI family protein
MPILLWWLALVGLAAAAGLIFVQLGGRQLRVLAFPLLFLLFALPLPVGLQNALQGKLQEITTTAAGQMLPVLGIAVQQKGNVLSLPSGDLGVVDACSGVRGVTAIIAVAALVAYLRGFGLVRGVVLTLLALPVVAASNVVRVVLSGLLQEGLGPWVNQGAAHEVLGVVTLLMGLAGVLAVSQLLKKVAPRKNTGYGDQPHGQENEPFPSDRNSLRTPVVQFLSAALLGVAVVGSAVAVWQAGRVVPGVEPDAPIADITLQIGHWSGTDDRTQDWVMQALGCDQAVHRIYRDPAGQQVHCWVLHWSAAAAVKDYIHHPDVCWPKQGWTPIGQARMAMSVPPAGTSVEMTVRRFERGGVRQMIVYWAQDGNRVWTAEEEERAHTSWPTQRWVLDRLLSRQAVERTPRLVVLVGADVWDGGGYAERAATDFARELAAELYRVCPWARPAGNSE